MLSNRWEPYVEMNRLRSEMDRLFDRWNGDTRRRFGLNAYPAINLWEDDDNLYVEAELPGFELDDLEIYVVGGNQLAIKGSRKPPELPQGNWHRVERLFGRFHRSIELPMEVESDNVAAEFQHGVLKVQMPKREVAKPRRIEVRVNPS